jgi:hypothetical protein
LERVPSLLVAAFGAAAAMRLELLGGRGRPARGNPQAPLGGDCRMPERLTLWLLGDVAIAPEPARQTAAGKRYL